MNPARPRLYDLCARDHLVEKLRPHQAAILPRRPSQEVPTLGPNLNGVKTCTCRSMQGLQTENSST